MSIRIEGNKIFLAELNEKDAVKLHEYSKEPELNLYSGPYKASESLESSREYIRNCRKNILERKSYIFGIYNKEGDLVGTIGFFDLDMENSSGEIGFWISHNYWNKGYITEAINLINNYIFNELKFHRIYAHFHELNKAVARVLEKTGYRKEGEFSESLRFSDGKFYSDIVYSIINSPKA